MKILILSNIASGLYEFRRDLIKKLIENGNEIYISCPEDKKYQSELEDAGCKYFNASVDRRGVNPIKDIRLSRNYKALMKNLKPDLVITYTIKPNVYGGFESARLGIPYAANITGLGTAFQGNGLIKKVVVFLYKKGLKKAKTIFYENIENMQTMIDLKICLPKQCKLLNGAGVNLEHFKYAEYPCEETTHFIFIGRIMKEKGIDELLVAMKRLCSEGYNCVLDILGRPEENYIEQIEQYKAEGWLNYYGYQEDVRPYIEKAHCFVLPSYHEGMANTNLECAAMGRPVITSNIHGCMEAVVDGVSGLLCEPKNADSLHDAMKKFIELSYDAKCQMGISGRKHMEEAFDKKKVVEETIKGLGI